MADQSIRLVGEAAGVTGYEKARGGCRGAGGACAVASAVSRRQAHGASLWPGGLTLRREGLRPCRAPLALPEAASEPLTEPVTFVAWGPLLQAAAALLFISFVLSLASGYFTTRAAAEIKQKQAGRGWEGGGSAW